MIEYRNDKQELHRLDGPAIVWEDGAEIWYCNDMLHRNNGPACSFPNGDCEYYRYGELHRLDGPARTWNDGDTIEYWINGVQYTEEEFKFITFCNGIKL